MIHRYLGKKSEILNPLLSVVREHAAPGEHVVDIFSGSLAVSMALKQAGYRVTANDVNLLSYMLGQAYLVPTQIPGADDSRIPRHVRDSVRDAARSFLESASTTLSGYTNMQEFDKLSAHLGAASLVIWLNHVSEADLPPHDRRSHFFDTYCEEGRNSHFRSSRGREGRRRFLTPTNARRLDLALNQIRVWHRRGLDEVTMGILLGAVMRGLEKVSNTQGTYHDFPRDRWDSRAFKPLTFEPQPTDIMEGDALEHRVGRARDSLEYIEEVEPHAVLYIDPPYNFRQYAAYYFLLNVVCRYPEMDDLDSYFAGVKYVRGQNPEDDFTSTFCKPQPFLDDIARLIDRAKARSVVISYFTGRNHWSDFDSARSDTGLGLLQSLLQGSIFEPGSLRVSEVERRNYASYGGYRARSVHELILTAKKRQVAAVEREDGADRGVPTVA
jgi:adenine-specific DNA-methyltransferase